MNIKVLCDRKVFLLYSASCILKKNKEPRVKDGHPWVYRSDVAEYHGEFEPGDIIKVCSSDGGFLAAGYINPLSKISIRILSRQQGEAIDENFFREKLISALELRERIAGDESSYRLFFAESDGIPGLIVDKYNDYLVMQALTLGIEVRRDTIISILIDLLNPKGIFEKSNPKSREPEGLDGRSEIVYGDFPELIEIQFDGLTFLVDVKEGQKTGFFLDQVENRRAFAKYVKQGDRVLDCFCYTGSFSLIAAQKGAQTIGLDASPRALEIAQKAARSNNLNCSFEGADVLTKLRELDEAEEQFDVITLDPPAFAKKHGDLKGAKRGYKEINLRAMRLLKKGGFLISCSCSQHIGELSFLNILRLAARDAQRRLKLLEIRGQSWDHPIDAHHPESKYLKFVIAQVV